MNERLSTRPYTTAPSAGNPSLIDPQSAHSCNGSGTSETTSPARDNTPYRVIPSDGQFVIEQAWGSGWRAIGTYADRATADEIVSIAHRSEKADEIGPDRDGGRGAHPRTAIPLSVVLADFDDISKSAAMAGAQHVPHRPPATELQALMESAPHADPEASLEDLGASDRMAEALATLTPKQLDAFLMHADGLSFRDIAARMGVHHGTVQGHVERARQRLAAFYGKADV